MSTAAKRSRGRDYRRPREVTEKHYLHTSPQQVAEAMAALGTRLAIG